MRSLLYATKRRSIVWDGDSLTARPPAGGGSISYPEFAAPRIRGNPAIVNIAVSGSVGGHAGYNVSPTPLAYVILTGHNHLYLGGAASTLLTSLETQIANVRGSGIRYVFVSKVFASVLIVGGNETERGVYNAALSGLDVDGVIDFETDPTFSNPSNFTDGTHDPEALRLRRGQIAAAVINSTLGFTP